MGEKIQTVRGFLLCCRMCYWLNFTNGKRLHKFSAIDVHVFLQCENYFVKTRARIHHEIYFYQCHRCHQSMFKDVGWITHVSSTFSVCLNQNKMKLLPRNHFGYDCDMRSWSFDENIKQMISRRSRDERRSGLAIIVPNFVFSS